jgi:uncharacterized glyoxalase superfamily protein PhnB
MVPARIDAVLLATDDLPGMQAFYRGLGWRGGPAFDLVGAGLELVTDVPGGAPMALVAEVEDIESALAAAVAAGATPLGAAAFADPAGTVWVLRPPSPSRGGAGGHEPDALVPRLSAITRATPDVLSLRDFYEALGFRTPMERRPDIAQFQTETGVFSTWIATEAAEEIAAPLAQHGHEFHGLTLAAAVEAPEHVDTALARAAAAGAVTLVEPEDKWWGGRSGYFADPAGTPWEVVWIPSATIDSQGILRLGT